jgi:hypothetical protein
MEKRWYPAAVSALVLGCGGSIDGGEPGTATGGTSGNIDGGAPSATGGMMPVYYGVVFPSGGSANVGGSGASTSVSPTGGKYGLGGFMTYYGPIVVGGSGGTTLAPITGGSPAATGGVPPVKYGPMPVGGTATTGGTLSKGGSSAKAATGGIDAGFPTGGQAGLGGQYTLDYGVLVPVGGSSDVLQPTGGKQPIIMPAYGVIIPTATGGSHEVD